MRVFGGYRHTLILFIPAIVLMFAACQINPFESMESTPRPNVSTTGNYTPETKSDPWFVQWKVSVVRLENTEVAVIGAPGAIRDFIKADDRYEGDLVNVTNVRTRESQQYPIVLNGAFNNGTDGPTKTFAANPNDRFQVAVTRNSHTVSQIIEIAAIYPFLATRKEGMVTSSNGDIYIGTNRGLYQCPFSLEPSSEKENMITLHIQADEGSVPYYDITDMIEIEKSQTSLDVLIATTNRTLLNPLHPYGNSVDGGLVYWHHESDPEKNTFLRLTWEDGLPSNDVRQLVRSSDGTIWAAFGGQYGGIAHFRSASDIRAKIFTTYKWNGSSFYKINWNNRASTSTAIFPKFPSNDVREIAADPRGGLWVASSSAEVKPGGLAYVDFENNVFQPCRVIVTLSNGTRALIDDARKVFLARDQTLWFAIENGALCYINKNPTTGAYPLAPTGCYSDSAFQQVRQLFETADGSIWAGTLNDGLIRLQRNPAPMTPTFNISYYNSNTIPALPDNRITELFEFSAPTANSVLWVGTQNGLTRLNYNTLETQHYTTQNTKHHLPNNIITSLFQIEIAGSGPRLFVGTEAGLAYYEPVDNALYPITLSNEASVPDKRAIYTLASVGGTAWFATSSGLYALSTGGSLPIQLPGELSPHRITKIIYAPDGSIWITSDGAYGSLIHLPDPIGRGQVQAFQRQSGQTYRLDYDLIENPETNEKHYVLQAKTNVTTTLSLLSNELQDVITDGQGGLWLAATNFESKDKANDGGVIYINFKTNLFLKYQRVYPGIIMNEARKLLLAANGAIWMASTTPYDPSTSISGALCRFDRNPTTGAYSATATTCNRMTDLMKVTSLAEDPTGRIWIGSQNGLRSFMGASFTGLISFRCTNPNIPADGVTALWYRPDDGSLWAGLELGLKILQTTAGLPPQAGTCNDVIPLSENHIGFNANFINAFLGIGNRVLVGSDRGIIEFQIAEP